MRMLLDIRNLGDNTLQALGGVVHRMDIMQTALTSAGAGSAAIGHDNRIAHLFYLQILISGRHR